MTILDRYILKKFLTALLATIVAFTVVILVVDIVERGWRLVQRYDTTIDIMVLYYLNYMPFYIILAFPVGMLVSTLFSMGSLARHHELDVMKASGLSLYRIVAPLLVAAFFISVGVMLFGELVLTDCERRKDEIKRELIEKRPKVSKTVRSNVKVLGDNGWIILSGSYDINSRAGRDVKVHRIVKNRIAKSYTARQIVYSDSGWVLVDGTGQEFSAEVADSVAHFIKFDTLWAPFLTQTPEMMAEIPVPPRQVDFFVLKKRIDQKKKMGEQVRREQVELYLKITFPFANFILVLIGAPLAANPRRSGPSVGFGLAVIISFIFFVLVRAGQSLGYNGKLPPLFAASLGNIVFLAVGFFLFVKARK